MDTNMETSRMGSEPVLPGAQEESAGKRKANPSAYLEKAPATFLMLFKLLGGLSRVCMAIVGAVLVSTIVSTINRTLAQESILADVKTMAAQLLNSAKVPQEYISQMVEVIPSQINFTLSGSLAMYVFMVFLPFAVLAALEAVSAVRLRLGKGGTTTIGVLHRIYSIVELVKILAAVIITIIFSTSMIGRIGFTAGWVVSVVFIGVGIFFILVRVPYVIYHHEIAGVMEDVRSEMTTGERAEVKPGLLKISCIILIVFTIIGGIVSIGTAAETAGNSVLFAVIIWPLFEVLKYVCVMLSYQNFLNADREAPAEDGAGRSHTPLIILVVILSLLFIAPTALLGAMSGRVSTAVSESVADYVSRTKDDVSKMVAEEAKKEAEAAAGKTAAQGAQSAGSAAAGSAAAQAESAVPGSAAAQAESAVPGSAAAQAESTAAGSVAAQAESTAAGSAAAQTASAAG